MQNPYIDFVKRYHAAPVAFVEEVLGVSDRIAVMHQGAISGFLEKDAFSEENVMHLAVRHPMEQEHAVRV